MVVANHTQVLPFLLCFTFYNQQGFFKDPNKSEDDINLSILEKVKLIDSLEEQEKNNLLGIIDMAIAKKRLKDNLSNLLSA